MEPQPWYIEFLIVRPRVFAGQDFYKPVVTPYEMEVACVR